MSFVTSDEMGVVFVEGPVAQPLLARPADVTIVLEACFSARTRKALLYSSNLTPGFFDVSSLDAGEVLQKLRNYSVRLAVVLDAGGAARSRRFHELLEAERRDQYFALFEQRSSAIAWLAGRGDAAGSSDA